MALGAPGHAVFFGIATAVAVGRERFVTSWAMGKGLVGSVVVIGVVLGSIYGGGITGITGITEAVGMGVVAVAVIATLRGEMSFTLVLSPPFGPAAFYLKPVAPSCR